MSTVSLVVMWIAWHQVVLTSNGGHWISAGNSWNSGYYDGSKKSTAQLNIKTIWSIA